MIVGLNYREDIDGMRAIAVLAVVAFHSFPEFAPGGFIGVDIFFVISGFLITTIITHDLRRNEFSVQRFYVRRIRRLFPALITILLACLVLGRTILFPDELQQLGKHIAAGAGFAANLIYWNESGYFDASAISKPLLHLWSLGVEEQFYIAWPAILWAAHRLRFSIGTTIATLAAASFCISLQQSYIDPVAAFYSPLSRGWELLIGAALAIWSPRLVLGQRPRDYLSLLGFFLLLIAFVLITPQSSFPGWIALIPCFGTASLLAAGPTGTLNRWLLSHPALVLVGLISYPLYLWHWPFLSFAEIAKGSRPTDTIRIGLVVASFLAAWLTFQLIEKPLRKPRTEFVATRALATTCFAIFAIGLFQFLMPLAASEPRGAALAQISSPSNPWKFASNETCNDRFPFPDTKRYAWWFCMLKQASPPTVILLGDSRTNDYYPGFAASPAFSRDNILSIGTCAANWADEARSDEAPTSLPCSANRPHEQMEFINAIIDRNPTIRLAIIGSLPVDPSPTFTHQLFRRISYLEAKGIQVAVFSPTVSLEYDIRRCYQRFAMMAAASCVTGVERLNVLRMNFRKLEDAIGPTHPRTIFFDTNFFCDDSRCAFKFNGMPIFRDSFEHISEHTSAELVKRFSVWARVNAPQLVNSKLDF